MSEQRKPKIEFAPGCFDHLGDDVTQEELDELVLALQAAVENGDLHMRSRALTQEEFDELPEEVRAQIESFEGSEARMMFVDPDDETLDMPLTSRKLH